MPWQEVSIVDQRREFVRLAMQTKANRHALMANTSRIFTPLQRASPWTSEAIFGFWPSVHDCRAAPRSP